MMKLWKSYKDTDNFALIEQRDHIYRHILGMESRYTWIALTQNPVSIISKLICICFLHNEVLVSKTQPHCTNQRTAIAILIFSLPGTIKSISYSHKIWYNINKFLTYDREMTEVFLGAITETREMIHTWIYSPVISHLRQKEIIIKNPQQCQGILK